MPYASLLLYFLVTKPDAALFPHKSLERLPFKLGVYSMKNTFVLQGPISIALFAEPTEVVATVRRVALLRTCQPAIRRNVTFSLVTPLEATNGGSSQGMQTRPHPPFDQCADIPLVADYPNYARVYPYPGNLLRNTARRAARTSFVFVIDVDMLPSANLREVSARSACPLWFELIAGFALTNFSHFFRNALICF